MFYSNYQIRGIPKRRAIFLWIFDYLSSLFIKKESIQPKKIKKILIIRNDHIGDLVLDTQIFREIKKKFPDVKITALISLAAKSIIEKDKNVENTIIYGKPFRGGFKGIKEYLKILKKIKKEKFDIGLDIRASLINIIFLLWAPKIKIRASYWNIGGGKAFLTNPIFYARNDQHTIEFDSKIVEKTLNFKFKSYFPEIYVDEDDKKEAYSFLKKNRLKKYICIVPGASNRIKKWQVENFQKIIKLANLKYPFYKILLIGGKEDKDDIEKLSHNKNCLSVIDFDIRNLSLIFKQSKLVLANDGGPMHISWVSGAKTIALWGPINLDQMKPLKNSTIIHHKKTCFPCEYKKCPKKQRCIDSIGIEEVWETIKKIIG